MKHIAESILIAFGLLWSMFAMANPEVKVNGVALSSSPAQIKLNGDNVNVTFADGTTSSFDMDDIVVNFKTITDLSTLQNNLFIINTTVENELVVTGVESGKMLSILSVNGISVYTGYTNSNETRIDISSFASGIYLLNINGKVVKFIKK